MKKNTKTTLKVLSGIALAGTIAVLSDNDAEAKTYKPEVRYQDGKYFIKTSDPAAKGKNLGFLIKQDSKEFPYYMYNVSLNYQNQEIEINKNDIVSTTHKPLTENSFIAIQDDEKIYPDPEIMEKSEYEKQLQEFYKDTASGAILLKDALKKEEIIQPSAPSKPIKEDDNKTKPVATSTIAEKYIESLKSEITPDGKVVVKFTSKEGLSYSDFIHASVTLFNDKTGNSTTHIPLYTNDGKNFTGDYAVENLENGVWKPYELSFTDLNGMPKTIGRKDLISYDKQSQVFIGVTKEEPIGSPQLQGKKVGVFANYKKVKKGTVVKYTIKTNDKELKDDSILLVRNGNVYFDHNASRFTHEYDSNGNRVIYVRTENLEPGIYNVISIDGKDKTNLEDIYNEDGWFEVDNEDVRREGPAVWDTVSTSRPDDTPKRGEDNTTKPERDNRWNPFSQGQKAKEGSTEVKSEAGEVATKPVSNHKEGKALPNTGLQTTSYGFLAAIVGLFGAIALRRKNR